MTRRLTLATLLVALALATGGTSAPAAAAASAPLLAADTPVSFSANPLEYLLESGWETVAPNVLRRELEDGRLETFAVGVKGLRWAVLHLEEELAVMESDFEAAPSDDLWEAMEIHRDLLDSARADLRHALHTKAFGIEEMAAAPVPGCNFNWGYWADARLLVGEANAWWYNTCGYLAYTYAYGYVSKTYNGVTTTKSQTDPKGPGTSLNSYAYASLSLPADTCYSYARAYVSSSDFGFFEATDTHSTCPPLKVTITGPTYVWVGPGACTTVTWTANASGGSGVYTNYAWTYNGVSVGTNSTKYSRTYCSGIRYTIVTDTVGVTVTDSSGKTASDTHSVTVEKEGEPFDPCTGTTAPGDIEQQLLPCEPF